MIEINKKEYRLLALRFLEVIEEIEHIENEITNLAFQQQPVLTELANSHYKQFVIKDELEKLLAGKFGKTAETICNDARYFRYTDSVE